MVRSLSLILAAVLLAACQRHGDAVQERLQAFGSETDIEIRGSPRDEAMLAIADAAQLLNQREREWHAWEASDLTRINAALRKRVLHRIGTSLGQLLVVLIAAL